ncbi:hypothetical protein R1flu_012571 [Riccia fluitans]|uniref:Uncharacterized protein n=1 Tax=Riccia fluitans TaxID=41844 RepID=A0ABD1ZB03_9MARC
MFRDGEAERKAYEERRRELLRRGCEDPDPWYGHTATDVTFALRPAVPKHSNPAADPCCNLTPTDITSQLVSRPNYAPDYYYGTHSTDVTAHLQTPVPTFVNPHGCGPQACVETLKRQKEINRAFDYMHPLGAHRPFPLSDLYFHRGPNPLGACESRSGSPSCPPRPRSRSPKRKSPRARSRSPRRKSRSRSRSPNREGLLPRSRSPRHYASHDQLPLNHSIPLKYLECRNKCQLCPPCGDCARLLEEDRRCRGI